MGHGAPRKSKGTRDGGSEERVASQPGVRGVLEGEDPLCLGKEGGLCAEVGRGLAAETGHMPKLRRPRPRGSQST